MLWAWFYANIIKTSGNLFKDRIKGLQILVWE